MKKFSTCLVALLLAASTVFSLAACNGTQKSSGDDSDPAATSGSATDDTTGGDEKGATTYTYQDSVSQLAANWNPHTYQIETDSYPADFIRVGLYGFIFNDASHPIEGKDDFAGYHIIPEMAASEPVDVTETVKAEHPEFNIPEEATSGYAYTIELNPNATWEDGTPINADTYVYSMQQLLRPELMNYRATDYFADNFSIAGAEAYYYGGKTSRLDSKGAYTVDSLTLGEDGVYYNEEGSKMFIGLNFPLAWTSGNTLADYVGAYGDAYFDITNWDALMEQADEEGLIPLTDENLKLFTPVVTGVEAWGETEAELPNYFVYEKTFEKKDFSTVGLYKNSDYSITLVLSKSLAGFNLLYNLTSNWIVYPDLYEANLTQQGDAWLSTYNTSVETTMSYGPYKLTEFQADKWMKFERNDKWYGYTDGNHTYVDPTDGETYTMYQTDVIECEVVAESDTNKLMFLKGELMTYGLQADDYATYRSSDYCYATPKETIFFMVLNGYTDAINSREANEDFDTAKDDLQTMTLLSFRKAVAITYDRDLFAATVSPSRSGGYGIIGDSYLYDPESGAKYRDTDQAKKALCEFYSVDISKFDSLDEAVDSITGYDPETAKVLYKQAFDEAIEAGYITDNDNDGISDQTVKIEYALSVDNDFMTKTINYLNEKMAEVTAGTPFEGKVQFVKSAVYGDAWSDKIKSGMSDLALAGWSGSALNPFGLTDLYVNPSRAYDGKWFDATTVEMTVTIDGEDITMTLKDWSDALNGATVNGYCFGDGVADVETRLDILAAFEVAILNTYDYLPMLQDGSMALLSQQVYYVIDDYNPVMGRGGIAYLKYNYNDAEWAAYVASQGGELKY